jgi:hypothetical protein
MGKAIIFLFLSASTLFLGACTDDPVEERGIREPEGELTVRISFVAAICGDAICKIEDPEYVGYGQRGFRYGGKTYDGVFKTVLPCPPADGIFQSQTALAPGIFRVRISKQPFPDLDNSCGRCMATFPEEETPAVFYYIKPQQK